MFTKSSLAVGEVANFSGSYTAPTACSVSDTLTGTATSRCGGIVSDSATATCPVNCQPCIRVEKEVACALGQGCGVFGKVATGLKGDNQNPAFCYRITVTNCGPTSLTNVTVIDDHLGNLTTSFFAGPTTVFAPGAVITGTFRASVATSTTNTVVAAGQSSVNGSGVSSTNSAVALVVRGTLTCSSMKASSPDDLDGNPNDNHVSLRQDGLAHSVTFTVTATSGNVALTNVQVSSPALAALGCTLPTISLAANSSSNLTCTVSVNCGNLPGQPEPAGHDQRHPGQHKWRMRPGLQWAADFRSRAPTRVRFARRPSRATRSRAWEILCGRI